VCRAAEPESAATGPARPVLHPRANGWRKRHRRGARPQSRAVHWVPDRPANKGIRESIGMQGASLRRRRALHGCPMHAHTRASMTAWGWARTTKSRAASVGCAPPPAISHGCPHIHAHKGIHESMGMSHDGIAKATGCWRDGEAGGLPRLAAVVLAGP